MCYDPIHDHRPALKPGDLLQSWLTSFEVAQQLPYSHQQHCACVSYASINMYMLVDGIPQSSLQTIDTVLASYLT